MRHRHGTEAPGQLDLFAPVERLMTVTTPFAIGVGAGIVVLFCLRAARLRFTWALWGLPLAYLLWPLDWQVGLGLASATVVAAGAGARWHFEDIGRGGEDARRARESLAPFHLLRRYLALRRAGQRSRVQSKAKGLAHRVSEDRLLLGTTPQGGVRHVPFGSSRGVHALIVGATGAGKTVTQAALAQAYVLAGLPAIVIDPKGDRFLRSILREAAAESGRRFIQWSPSAGAIYNPFARGNPTEIADKVLAGQRWSEPHYELATRRLLGHVLATMQAAGEWPPTLTGIVRHMDPERLDLLASKVGGEIGAQVADYVDGLSARAKTDLGGGRDRLAVLAESELGPQLDPNLGQGPPIDFRQALQRGDVIYMHLDADRYPAASKLLGAALVIDLIGLVAEMQGGDARALVVIDEFAALAAEQVSRLFGRARSAGLSVVLGTQSLADLRGACPEDASDTLTEQVLTNIEFAVVHREADPDSAERLARMAGTQPSWSVTTQIGGRREGWMQPRPGTRTRERDFVVNPDAFKRLKPGEAVLISPTAQPPAEIVRVLAPKERE